MEAKLLRAARPSSEPATISARLQLIGYWLSYAYSVLQMVPYPSEMGEIRHRLQGERPRILPCPLPAQLALFQATSFSCRTLRPQASTPAGFRRVLLPQPPMSLASRRSVRLALALSETLSGTPRPIEATPPFETSSGRIPSLPHRLLLWLIDHWSISALLAVRQTRDFIHEVGEVRTGSA